MAVVALPDSGPRYDGAVVKVLISGSSGLVGSALARSLRAAGHQVPRLVRRRPTTPDAVSPKGNGRELFWDPAAGALDSGALDGVDAVVHLAGENIAGGRWTAAMKRRISESRVAGTGLIARAVAAADPPPVLISASAIGYYGDRGDQQVDEQSVAGEGFLAGVCRRWEAATEPAAEGGARVVCPRIGVVLSRRGGALKKMLTPFRLGLGGVVGSGRQVISWIHLDDLVGVIEYALSHPDLSGPLNAVAPDPVTNRELTRTLGRVLRRPTLVPMPAPLVRLVFGEMGQELLLAGIRVAPARLVASDFVFRFGDLESALRHELRAGA